MMRLAATAVTKRVQATQAMGKLVVALAEVVMPSAAAVMTEQAQAIQDMGRLMVTLAEVAMPSAAAAKTEQAQATQDMGTLPLWATACIMMVAEPVAETAPLGALEAMYIVAVV